MGPPTEASRTRRRPRVAVVGAGFGGLECARRLSRTSLDVLLLDRNNYHLFTPLLYQVASSLLNPSDIAIPIRAVLRGSPNVRFRQAEVRGVDLERRRLILAEQEAIEFDYLVIAAGSVANFFGLADVAAAAHGLKDLSEALALRNHILHCFEAASCLLDPAARAPWLTFVVVGGGPTGVEYAGALSELARLVLAGDYPEFDVGEVRILLVEGLARLLPAFPEPLAAEGQAQLERRGVRVTLGARLAGASGDEVRLSTGERIQARTLVWAAGVRPADLAAAVAAPRTRGGRLETDAFLRLPGHDHVFAIGDLAAVVQDGAELPMLAPPAQQQGRSVAANLVRIERGLPPVPFRYRDRGTMATIGRNAAVAVVGRLRLKGFVGWAAWLFLHLYMLIGFRNRLLVLIEWAWEYLRYDRPVRIIARAKGEPPKR